MALEARYSDLITDVDLVDASLNGVSVDLSDAATATALPGIIRGVTSDIERFLDRRLIASSHTDRVPDIYWSVDHSLDQSQDVYVSTALGHWPVLQVASVTSQGSAAEAPSVLERSDAEAQRRVYTDYDNAATPILTITYYAGYRRHDQDDLSSLKTESGLADLAALPEVLPDTIRQAAIDLCLHRLAKGRSDTGYGMRRSTFQVGSGTGTSEGVVASFEGRVFDSISTYRRVA